MKTAQSRTGGIQAQRFPSKHGSSPAQELRNYSIHLFGILACAPAEINVIRNRIPGVVDADKE